MSLVETRRENGKVRHEHVASLGSIETPPSIADRVAFWAQLHERLARLANRIDGDMQCKVLGAVHARIPMPTAEEQRELQLENAKADAERWSSIEGVHVATVEGHKQLAATIANAIANGEQGAARASARANAARERVARIKRGENVEGGLGRPMTAEEWEAELLQAGFSREELLDMRGLAQLTEAELRELMPQIHEGIKRVERAVIRAALRRLGR